MSTDGDFQDFLNHLTDNALHSLRHADVLARAAGSAYVGTEHLLLGVLAQRNSSGSKLMRDNGVTIDKARTTMTLKVQQPVSLQEGASKGLSEAAKLTLRMSWEVAQEYAQESCGTEHILYSLLSQKNASASTLMKKLGVRVEDLLFELDQVLSKQSYEQNMHQDGAKRVRKNKKTLIDKYSADLTAQAKQGKLDAVVGREPQIKRLITILNRRTKNNPVLIGDPGVGKTAIVEGVASRIVADSVPDALLDKRILVLDLAAMLAGTKYRGEFEDRLKKVMNELEEDDNTIVFIDEVHQLVGAGSAEGSMDAGNILKPALARGKVQVIGATTTDEYTKHIEKDAALERRLQPIIVPETSESETLAILRGLRKNYEDFHNVRMSDEVLIDTVRLAGRYIQDRFMPDKAIDLLDETAAHVRVNKGITPPKVRELQKEMKLLQVRIEEAVDAEDYERAAKEKQKASQLQEELDSIIAENGTGERLDITSNDIADTVSRMSGVPVSKVVKSEVKYLKNLEKKLSQYVIGQNEAVSAVARAVRRSRSGISEESRPIGSFVFMGPTGVGKTELARVLAKEFFGNKDALIKIDMSEFSERHTSSRLVGAPAGYVGYEDGGQLTDKVRRQPYSVILFDEIEKAHPDVFNMLLQLLEDGVLTDGKGRKVSFANTIIIMTSNVGAEKLQKEARLGFSTQSKSDKEDLNALHEQNKEDVRSELKKLMRPELLNRIDKIIVFRALTRENVLEITDVLIDGLNRRLARSAIAVEFTAAAKKLLVDKGYDAKNGARPLRRVLQDEVEDYIADQLLDDALSKGVVITVGSSKKEFTFNPSASA